MNVDIIGVPIDLGANRRGVDMGPSAIRYGGLEEALSKMEIHCRDLGNIHVPLPEKSRDTEEPSMKHFHEIKQVNEMLYNTVRQSHLTGNIPLILGGDHSIAVGSILGSQSVIKNIGVIWMDAHGDFNTRKTTLSGNMHGMSLAASVGIGEVSMASFKDPDIPYINPEKVVLVGVRDLDREEALLIKKTGVTVFTIADIDMVGIRDIMKKAIAIASADTEGFHVSFDMDVINPNEAPGVGTPVYGGLTYREAHLAAEMIACSGKLRSMEIVEVNPILDNRNQTGQLAVTLVCSLLGKRIL